MHMKLLQLSLKIVVLGIGLLVTTSSFSQRNIRDSIIGTPWIGLHYGLNGTGKDLAQKFGLLNHLGGKAGYKTNKNFVWGVEGNFIFGNQIKLPNLLSQLTDTFGNVFDENGNIAKIAVNARGFNANLLFGKVFPVLSPNENSGVYAHMGLGYVQHKVRIETQDQYVPTLEKNYRKGYDRYTTGINFHQFLGYCYLSNNGLVNFYGGFYLQEAFTKNRREVFFDLPDVPVPTNTMFEIQYGCKVGWFVPVYRRKPKDFYYD
jgi:hypothetical protein